FIARVLEPFLNWIWTTLHIDPSMITSMIFCGDCGGASLATEVAMDVQIGRFSGLVVSSMMGMTITFTIAFGLTVVKPQRHEPMLLGMLIGVLTIPTGCFVAGLMMAIPVGQLLYNMLPLFLFSVLIALGLVFAPQMCTKIFNGLGVVIKGLITIGLALGLVQYVTGIELIQGLMPFEEAASICIGAAVVLTGALPMLKLLSQILHRQIDAFARKLGVNDAAAKGFISCLASGFTVMEAMNDMDDKGIMLNAAFAISAAFVFADHLAFTLSYDAPVLPAMIVGKLISGLCAVVVANVIYAYSARKSKAAAA
ncbi:MAG: ethanolamine utilization protein EutH, partial [Clostridia bacterium]|nr:ethanolamine utilization protein EutH [Clostridia bacterium]